MLLGSLSLLLLGAWARRRAAREFRLDGRVSVPTFIAGLLAFTIHAAAVGAVSVMRAWPLPLAWLPAVLVGGLLAGLGATLYLAARVRFRLFRLTWRLTTDRLVTGGVYRHTRNPQGIGVLLIDIGAAMIGRSGQR
jgi:protein-S-isoprenylcysteine O-methyltransferase Ste14